jgi:hypothetical protein
LQTVHSISVTSTKPNSYLINGPIDALMLGGISIILFLLFKTILANKTLDNSIGWFIFNLSFVVNFPHFLVSYQLLYIDSRHLIPKMFRFFWAAIIVPILLLGAMIVTAMYGNQAMLGYFTNAMFLLVGWHYVKQIFGCIIVTNALKKFYYNTTERYILLANLYSIWALSWVSTNLYATSYSLYGIPYKTFSLPVLLLPLCYISLILTFGAVLIMSIRKYTRDKVFPGLSSIVSFITIYIWFLPTLYNPIFFLLIPFFHSLQYLPFVYAFRRNKIRAQLSADDTLKKRLVYFIQLYGYLLIPFITGAVFLWFLPNYIDSLKLFNITYYGPTLAMFGFTIFINIHHYFIDNVVWKGSNPEVRKYMF